MIRPAPRRSKRALRCLYRIPRALLSPMPSTSPLKEGTTVRIQTTLGSTKHLAAQRGHYGALATVLRTALDNLFSTERHRWCRSSSWLDSRSSARFPYRRLDSPARFPYRRLDSPARFPRLLGLFRVFSVFAASSRPCPRLLGSSPNYLQIFGGTSSFLITRNGYDFVLRFYSTSKLFPLLLFPKIERISAKKTSDFR